MQIDASETRRVLERMVARLTSHRLWHEDLIQEALIHLWQEVQRCPGQTAGWYLRSCKFHLRNQLRLGRSIDSPKRRDGLVVPKGKADPIGFLTTLVDATATAPALQTVMARDLFSSVKQQLTALEREILACLADGLGTRETARRLNISHTCVAKKRRRIANLITELEAKPHTNGTARTNGQNGFALQPSRLSDHAPGSRFQFQAGITSLVKAKNGVGRATIHDVITMTKTKPGASSLGRK